MDRQQFSRKTVLTNQAEQQSTAYEVNQTRQLVEQIASESGLGQSQTQWLWQTLCEVVQQGGYSLRQLYRWLQAKQRALIEFLKQLGPTHNLSRSEWLAVAMAAGLMISQAVVPALVQAADPVGSEFKVNTYTTDIQRIPSVAMDNEGDFVVAWASKYQDGDITSSSSRYSIYAQRYNASGIEQGSEFLVNTYTTHNQAQASVAMDSNGDFVVAWESYGQDGSYLGIYAQRYNASGAAQGDEFKVNTYTTGNQDEPSAAMDSAGNFVVAWESRDQDGSLDGVYAQRYNASGTEQGTEFRVNSYTTDNQRFPSVAMDSNGDFVVAWHSSGQDGSGNGIYAQRYNATGIAQGDEFRVNTYTTSSQSYASVAMDTDGNFVVAWTSRYQDGSNYGIYAQRYNASGTAQGSEFKVNTYTMDDQQRPTVAMDSDGDFVVAWASKEQDGSVYGTYAQRYNASGLPLGSEFKVNTYTTGNQRFPSAAMDSDGDFAVVWESGFNAAQDGSKLGVYAQRFSQPPEIMVSGNSQEIVDGDANPTTEDHTDFGEVVVNSGSMTHTFTISNSDLGGLTVGTVSLSGMHASDFNVTQQPSSPVATSGSTTFQITFTPSATGTRTAEVSFTNSDSDETPYNFTVQGTGMSQLYLPIIHKS